MIRGFRQRRADAAASLKATRQREYEAAEDAEREAYYALGRLLDVNEAHLSEWLHRALREPFWNIPLGIAHLILFTRVFNDAKATS